MGVFVVLYSIVMIVTFIIYLYKKKCFDIGALLLLVWSVASVMSVYIYYNIEYYTFSNISILPYIFFYFILMYCFSPFLKFDEKVIRQINGNNKILYYISIILISISVLPAIENLIQLIKTFSLQNNTYYIDIYNMRGEEQEFKYWMDEIGKRMNTVCLLSYLFTPLLLFYWLGQKKKNLWIVFGLLISIINVALYSTVIATRVALISQLLYIVFLYMMTKNTLNDKIVKNIKKYGAIFIIGIIIFLLAISISRYENKFLGNVNYSMYGWFFIYGGESTLRFNADMWNINKYMEGDNCFSLFKESLGLDTYTDLNDRRYYWAGPTGILQNVFYTFIGDIFGDFGPFGCILILIIIVSLVNVKRKEVYEFHELIPFSLWYYVCIFGFTYNPFKTYFANKTLVFNAIMYFVIRIFSGYKNNYDNLKNKI